VLLAGGGTVAAASNSMPDSILYPVKLATENVQLALTTSELGRVRLCAGFADERVAEIIYMAERGDAHEVEVITKRLDDRLDTLAVLVSKLEADDSQGFLWESSGDAGGSDKTNGAPPAAPTEDADVDSSGPEEPVAPVTVEEGGGIWGGRGQPQNRAELRVAMFDAAVTNPAVLRAMLEEVPESVKAALLEAIAVLEDGYENVLEALE